MIELSRSRKANRLALVAILGILGSVVLAWKAGEEVSVAAGPGALASTGETVYFVAGGTLYVADAGGALQDEFPLAALGLGRVVSQLAVIGDDLLVADGARGTVHRCDLARRACAELVRIPMRGHGAAMAVAAAPDADRLYVADTSGHELHVYSLKGKPLYRIEAEGGLKYPNEVLWLGDGRLLVVDTNHHRIVVLADEGDGHTRLLQKMAAKNDLGRGNTWPITAARDGHGNTWAVVADGLLNNGELILYDAEGRPQRHIELGEGADPVALAPLADSMLLADLANYRLLQIGVGDHRVEAFGDAALRDVLQTLQARHSHGLWMRYLSIGMMMLFAILGAVAAYFDSRARREYAAAQRQVGAAEEGGEMERQDVVAAAAGLALRPDARGIVWLGASRRVLRWQQAVFVLSVLMFGGGTALLLTSLEVLPARLVALLAGVVALGLGLNGWLIYGMKRLRVGTDGKMLHVVDLFGRQGKGLPEAFIHTGRRLLLGRIAVPLPNSFVSMFDRKAFAAVVEPMLGRTQRSNEFAVLGRKLRQGDPLSWLGLAAVVAALALKVWLNL
ncbi:MAG: hypothetical protein Q7T65_10335 [Thiobacillus sp.]|nr:hypothetical protein [Thiobacillus sp.]